MGKEHGEVRTWVIVVPGAGGTPRGLGGGLAAASSVGFRRVYPELLCCPRP